MVCHKWVASSCFWRSAGSIEEISDWELIIGGFLYYNDESYGERTFIRERV